MTGETKDAIGGFVAYLQALSLRQRRDAMLELLDHACQRCGSELPKWGPCEVCGQLRPDDE
jgi:predicted amidophosphoribosyltransferase